MAISFVYQDDTTATLKTGHVPKFPVVLMNLYCCLNTNGYGSDLFSKTHKNLKQLAQVRGIVGSNYLCYLHEDYLLCVCYLWSFFFFFWLWWVFIAQGLSLVAASRGYSSFQCPGFSLQWLLLLQSIGPRACGLSSSGSQVLEHRLSSCGTRVQLLCGIWNLLSSGIEPLSPDFQS